MRLGDRIALLRAGRLVQHGRAEELYLNPANLFAAGFFSELNLFPATVRGGVAETPVGKVEAPGFADEISTVAARLRDLILARGVCEREAAEKGVSVEQHATHLVVHGTLHLLGYDHQADGDAADMEAREVKALARLGIANPYENH